MMRQRSGWPLTIMVAPRRLDRAPRTPRRPELQKNTLSANVAAHSRSARRLLARDAIEVGRVPELLGLLGQGRDELGVGVAERIDGDAARRSRGSARRSWR